MPQITRKQTSDYKVQIIKELEAVPDRPVKTFSEFDDEIIKKYYLKKGCSAVSRVLNRNRCQISNRAKVLGISKP